MSGGPLRQLRSSFVRGPANPAPTSSSGAAGEGEGEGHDAAYTGPKLGDYGPLRTKAYSESLLQHKSFYFQQRRGSLNLRSISRVDVDKVIRDVDIDTLQSFLENITFSDLGEEELRLYSDDAFLRLFQLTQLTIEYLLNVQDTLASNLDSLAQKYSRKKRELERVKLNVKERDEEVERLKREGRRKRKTVRAYEAMLRKMPPACGEEDGKPPKDDSRKADNANTATESLPGKLKEENAAKIDTSGDRDKVVGTSNESGPIHVYVIRQGVGGCLEIQIERGSTVKELKVSAQGFFLFVAFESMNSAAVGARYFLHFAIPFVCRQESASLILLSFARNAQCRQDKLRSTFGSDPYSRKEWINMKGRMLPDLRTLAEEGVKDESVLVWVEERTQQVPEEQPEGKRKEPQSEEEKHDRREISTLEIEKIKEQGQESVRKAEEMLRLEIERAKEREAKMREEMESRIKAIEQGLRREVQEELNLRGAAAVHRKQSAPENSARGVSAIAEPRGAEVMQNFSSGAGDIESDSDSDDSQSGLSRAELSRRVLESEDMRFKMEGIVRDKDDEARRKEEELDMLRQELEGERRVREREEEVRERERELEEREKKEREREERRKEAERERKLEERERKLAEREKAEAEREELFERSKSEKEEDIEDGSSASGLAEGDSKPSDDDPESDSNDDGSLVGEGLEKEDGSAEAGDTLDKKSDAGEEEASSPGADPSDAASNENDSQKNDDAEVDEDSKKKAQKEEGERVAWGPPGNMVEVKVKERTGKGRHNKIGKRPTTT